MQLHVIEQARPFRPSGFRPAYHLGSVNHCPGCGRTQWHVGRSSAQCAFCATAVPFAQPAIRAA